MEDWVFGKIVNIKYWNDYLFSIIISANVDSFVAGQFTKLGTIIDGKKILRSYSYVNSPHDEYLEFYLINVQGGKFSTYLYNSSIGDNIMIRKKPSGFFVLNNIPSCKNLWMISTGTAIGPYLSILKYGVGLERFENIVLIHAVRFFRDLSYLNDMKILSETYKKIKIRTVVSREKISGSLFGRIPNLICSGLLESEIGVDLDRENSHVMLCGNPNMVSDTVMLLEDDRGMKKNSKNRLGNITIERYW
ncbi:MAG: flavodoxin/ferredoxin-NADP(+) reductase [Candidatus Westeberhardia cardiocondylae]|nr:flavodoxin/ferredoxin-NADP(+) reductase [Candidatus Westeberhardia cardiocondylae]